MRPTCQPVGSEHAQADGKQGERVDDVHAEVEDALEHHHPQPQLQDAVGDRRVGPTSQGFRYIPATSLGRYHPSRMFAHAGLSQTASYQSEDQVIESRGGQQEEQDGEEQSPDDELQRARQRSASVPRQ